MPDKTKEYEDKIKSLSADLELIAHITSHDLRDPLRQAVINLQEMPTTKDNAQIVKETLSSIDDVLQRIALLREYSYLANFNKEMSEVDCNKVMQNSLNELKEDIEKSGAEIKICKLPTIKGFEPHIQKLFTALIANAIKFNTSCEPELEISCQDADKMWQFKFSDNGIGLDPIYQNFVFSLFQRMDPDAPNAGYGTGLAFCKKIVENHHGKIWFESDGENGTDFYFTLAK